ncbi:arginase family protein [Streptomyces sp. NPDC096046]|uniref:arginase family protein n=1 Tax=Streptomyces sp. NPDC096046 TaxID=3155542 RepID=UPI0033266DA2
MHIDLDVLDPWVFPAVGTPEPGGLGIDDLLGAVRALTGEFTLAGLALTECERGRTPVRWRPYCGGFSTGCSGPPGAEQ